MKRILILFLPFLSLSIAAQDLHLSQYYTNHAMINPALVGDHIGDNTLTFNYRNQWAQINNPLHTTAFAYERRFYNGLQEYQAGILFLNDQFTPFSLNRFGLMLSFGLPLKLGKHRITPGIRGGIVLMNGDYSNRTHPNQWNYTIGEFDQNIASGEGTYNEAIQYPDLTLGFTHSMPLGQAHQLRWGYAIHHLNKPNITRLENARLALRHTVHLGLELTFNDRFVMNPEGQYSTTTGTDYLLAGSRVTFKQAGSFYNGLFTGAYYRSNLENEDALVPVFGIIFKTIQIGVSYDVNISELSSLGDRKSTLEFSIRYMTPSSSPDQFSIPCIRY
jgi:type IX secretion system PorP/SprF family membrane protein